MHSRSFPYCFYSPSSSVPFCCPASLTASTHFQSCPSSLSSSVPFSLSSLSFCSHALPAADVLLVFIVLFCFVSASLVVCIKSIRIKKIITPVITRTFQILTVLFRIRWPSTAVLLLAGLPLAFSFYFCLVSCRYNLMFVMATFLFFFILLHTCTRVVLLVAKQLSAIPAD